MQASVFEAARAPARSNALSLTLAHRLLRRLRVFEAQAAEAAQHDDSARMGDAHCWRNRRSRLLDGLVGLVDVI